ncbi:M20/M25/M40 family metallo-hydrolase [Spirochaeta cellobiosiphila]|uniref:M20/M25/M40 family metallo-hydrolase n=1 Tax=Spirochaeta cellobiosiphila TaxID=504483 RepID=UPI000429F57B|nr:M20/M25/M40 family metallo-hydrolase [Spirochaeta cellobiosiphila]
MINLKETLPDVLKSLISFQSVTGEEKVFADSIELLLSSYSGDMVRVHNSIVYKINANADSHIAFIGHIDTVPVEDSTTEAYEEAGYIYGRGACDMKAGLAVMLKMIDDIESKFFDLKHNVSFVFYEGEEGPLPNGINLLLDKSLISDIDFAYVLEPTEGLYSVACLGSLTVKKTITGVSAHSANPRTGKSAMIEALQVCDAITRMDAEINQDDNISGYPFYQTVNVTTFNTSNAFNVIPSQIELLINYRFSPKLNSEEAMDILLSYISEENIEVIDNSPSCYAGDNSKEYLLPHIKKEVMQAWTDIAQLNNAGIPAVNYGPGSIKNAHKPDERIRIQELSDYYSNIILHL